MKETERAAAEKRGLTALRYQNWENGKGGEQVRTITALHFVVFTDASFRST